MSRPRNLADQQQRLSEATWSVLTERGLPGLTIRAVAERAGCTTGLVMHAFPTKEALLLHARDLLHSRTGEQLDAAEATTDAPERALRAVMLDAMSLDEVSVDEARVWVSYLAAALADPTLAERHVTGNRRLIARVTRLVQACRPAWSADRAGREALALISLADGANTLSTLDPETYSPAAQRRMMTDAIDRMLGSHGHGDTDSDTATTGDAPTFVSPAEAGLRIRPFRASDTEAVVALWDACGLTRPWNDPRKDIARKLTTQPELFLVAESGTLVGTAMAGYDGHRGWVNYLAVDPDMQGRGLGRALMAEVEQRLEALGCPKVNLQVREGNEPVMEFYRAIGYTRDAAVSFGKRLIPDL
ncbi:GNAT family acetyltransferase [Herbiconiux ginsengi]|uniref:Transcriptional regulator, TetR family n=1 Tax=Herbiconiux ginsengi TaxID=381665 RepID=A0A1H3TLR1_9MICO|nr:GNAT family acetyltransferase [Herbiconiux ginsengi]SDZ51222.1 transcriptional regulator, TetR family [Herbiconiux ginsengi]